MIPGPSPSSGVSPAARSSKKVVKTKPDTGVVRLVLDKVVAKAGGNQVKASTSQRLESAAGDFAPPPLSRRLKLQVKVPMMDSLLTVTLSLRHGLHSLAVIPVMVGPLDAAHRRIYAGPSPSPCSCWCSRSSSPRR